MPTAAAIAAPCDRSRAVAIWLFAVAAAIFLMVVIGGITRLTESGLSIVDWRPVTGILPPLSEAAWTEEFAKYRASPQYLQVNRGMSLAEFQQIFWWEWVHRFWGRMIGLAFALPFLWFLWRGAIPAPARAHLWIAFGLGALQGLVGWLMVASGLVDRPSVSQYRLVAHLGLALAIYAYLLWIALGLWRGQAPTPPGTAGRRLAPALASLLGMTMVSGGFVAGIDAGTVYNTFPTMEGDWIPPVYGQMTPWWANLFENAAAVQFNHRVLAMVTVIAVLTGAGLLRRASPLVRGLALAAAAAALAQAGLGIATLLLHVPVALGALHQAGAVILLTLLVALAHATRHAARAPTAMSEPAPSRYRNLGRA